MKRIAAFVGALVLAAGLAGCGESDPGITTAVKSKFATDDTVKAYQINVDTSNKVVTLTGNVDSAAAKDRAVMLARDTKGVARVVDNLVVSAPPPATTGLSGAANSAVDATSDAALTATVKTKLLADSRTSGLKIDVDTKDKVVTLSGKVASAAERRTAVQIAKDTDGVKDVHDNLTVGGQ
ncbi:MAG TPA: BON domain-containing protein [Vicinamibacterales bacterium]|nr:BON domain-containing protein [Vicinamibacterales bacterium]